jgi:TonB-dependent starch-binding outer membrane protein SusC
LFISFGFRHAWAQDSAYILKGKVTNVQLEALAGVNVIIQESNLGTTTDANGDFKIKALTGQTLIFSFIGHDSRQIIVANAGFLNIRLQENTKSLSDVVVIGYGKIPKKDITGSIVSLSAKEIAKAMPVNVTEALNGRVSGVLVTKASNRPGADMSIRIRGENSFNFSNEPLYVINGVPNQLGMRNLNPADIESIDILKDASSTAIYGSRGSNGVVIITTKGANKKEGFNIEYNGYAGIKTPTRIPDMLGNKGNGMEYLNFRIAQWKTKFGASSLSSPSFLTQDERRHVKYGEYYDWLREFSKDAITTNNSVLVTGGAKNTSYSFGLGAMKDGGIAGSENFERLTSNMGIEQRIDDKLKAGLNINISYNIINHGSSDALFNAYLITPIVGRFQADYTPTFSHRPDGRVNPFIQDENTKHISEGWAANVSTFLEYKPIKQLALKTLFASQYDGATSGTWDGTNSQYGQGIKLPNASRSEGFNKNWVWDNTVTYDAQINEVHKFNAIGLFSVQKDTHKSSGMVGQGLPYQSDWHAIQTANQITNVNSNYWESSMLSVMGRLNYSLLDKYLLTITTRYDGTSRLAKDNRWGLFPSAAIGWQLQKENFLSNVKFINGLKLRASWGKTGNNNVDHNVTLSRLGLSSYPFGGTGQKGFGLGGSIGNESLKWEMTSEFNFGLDFGFFNNRISGSLEIYDRKTADLIMRRQVAELNGYNSILQNIGSTSNKGIELSLNTVNISIANFTWKTNFTFSKNKNAIVDLDGTKQSDLANRRFIGYPINVYYDVEAAGIWQEDEKALAAGYSAAPGWIKVVDQDKNGTIDANDYKILGAPVPDWTGGITNTFNYKNWDMYIFAYTRVGGLYSDPFTFFFTGINNQDWNKLDVPYWTPENRNNKYPGIGLETLYTQVLAQVPGTFLKIQNITLGYSFKERVMKRLKTKGLRVYAAVQNPFTFSSYLGADPEIIGESLQTQLSLYPITASFGLNVKF